MWNLKFNKKCKRNFVLCYFIVQLIFFLSLTIHLIFVSKGECLSLDKQIEYFTSTVVNDLPRNFRSKARLRHYLSKSIFLLSIGSNDYILNYLKQEIIANKFGNPDEFADYLLVQLSSSIKVHFLKQTMLIINIVSFTVCENLKFLEMNFVV
jgi:hypothetical protein